METENSIQIGITFTKCIEHETGSKGRESSVSIFVDKRACAFCKITKERKLFAIMFCNVTPKHCLGVSNPFGQNTRINAQINLNINL